MQVGLKFLQRLADGHQGHRDSGCHGQPICRSGVCNRHLHSMTMKYCNCFIHMKSAISIKLRNFQSDLAMWFLYSVALKNWPLWWVSWELKHVLKISSAEQYLCSLPKRLPSCRGIPGPNICTSHSYKNLPVESSFVGWVLPNSSLVLHTLAMNTCHLLLFQNSLT